MKIMIVEDDQVSREVMVNIMLSFGECIPVDNGREAISLYDKSINEKSPFDLITLDISMPGLDGITVLNIIRSKEKIMEIPKEDRVKIVMATASMRKKRIKESVRYGCCGYILKPYNSKQIYKDMERLGFDIPKDKKDEDKESYTQLVAEIIKRFNKGEIELPVLPHLVQEVQRLMKDKNPSIAEVAELVETDAVMSTKLISVANSALYKGVDTVTTLINPEQIQNIRDSVIKAMSSLSFSL